MVIIVAGERVKNRESRDCSCFYGLLSKCKHQWSNQGMGVGANLRWLSKILIAHQSHDCPIIKSGRMAEV